MNSTVRQYLDQYVKTAGRGNVVVEWAFLTQRVHFSCKKCKEELTASAPTDQYTINNTVQDWIRLHAHASGVYPSWKNMNPNYLSSPPVSGVAQTSKSFFESLPSFQGVPMANGRQFTQVPPPPPEPSPTPRKALKTRQGRKFR